jgi:hypothetical protein
MREISFAWFSRVRLIELLVYDLFERSDYDLLERLAHNF